NYDNESSDDDNDDDDVEKDEEDGDEKEHLALADPSVETDIQEKEQKESQKQTNPSTRRKGTSQVEGTKLPTPPKKSSFPPQIPVTTCMSPHTFSLAKPLDTLAKIISSTLLTHPSCINAKLAIPLHSQSISMAEIASKEAQMNLKAGICFRTYLTQQAHLVEALTKETLAASPRDEDFSYK
ncbi:hypothetical protein Tco_0076885, partial [Tanacetum coccineum]